MHRHSHRLLVFFILCGFSLSIFSQPLPTATPESVGLSSERLSRINHFVKDYVDTGQIAGMSSMVARRGKLVHFETYGKMNLETGKAMEKDAIFRIYSMTKPITSVAIMMLYEEGHFQLDSPVSEFIPAFKGAMVYSEDTPDGKKAEEPNREMTVQDLLRHTSGLTYGFFGNTPVDSMYRAAKVMRTDKTLADMSEKLGTLPLLHHPGEVWHYGVSTDVLGHLVEVVSGQSLDVFFKERIFDPLKMHDTGFFVPEKDISRFVTNYQIGEDGALTVADAPATSRYTKPPTFLSGGGGLVSTISDYMRFAQMFLNKGELDGVRLLGRKTVEYMRINHLKDDGEFAPGYGFGLGFAVMTDAVRARVTGSEGTHNWGGLANTYFFIDPQEEIVGILFAQFFPSNYYPIRRKFSVAIYQSIID